MVLQPEGYEMSANSHALDSTFAALSDPTRRAILARLASGEASVAELAKPFSMSQPAISKHLKVLERAGLISRGRDAQRRPRRLEPKPLAEADAWLENYRQIWEANYRRLDAVLDELKTLHGAKPPQQSDASGGKKSSKSTKIKKGEQP
jgi:DNA-binding transcriptional ArsR family regulator